jgi:hypothetical protein
MQFSITNLIEATLPHLVMFFEGLDAHKQTLNLLDRGSIARNCRVP